jgi:hypothetical protein
MVKSRSGHKYYTLKKDVPVKYIASQSNPTGAKGVLLHNKKGYIDGKEGAYIIDYFGGHYYVDMENQFASYIYKIKDQDRGFITSLTKADEAPEHADWRDFMREIPFENMKHLKGYENFLNETSSRLNEAVEDVETRVVKFNINVNDDMGTIEDQVTLAIGPSSSDMFSIGDDIEKFTGLKLADAEAYDEKPTDAFVYGMNNMMNGGGDMFFWITGNRLAGDVAEAESWTALFDVFPHECIHLTKKLIIRQHAKNLGVSIDGEEWIKHDYGQGEYVWPSEGDHKDPMVIISEEDFAWVHGFVCKTLAPHFLELAKPFLPEIK